MQNPNLKKICDIMNYIFLNEKLKETKKIQISKKISNSNIIRINNTLSVFQEMFYSLCIRVNVELSLYRFHMKLCNY